MPHLIYKQLIRLYPLFKRAMEGSRAVLKREIKFISKTLTRSGKSLKSIIDLGGGIGMHAIPLSRKDYHMTIYDSSKLALNQVKKTHPQIATIHNTFEKINLKQSYDAATCLWSTFPYILTEHGRKRFYTWLKTHIRHLIILDEANFYRYLKLNEFHKVYPPVHDTKHVMTLTRDWIITPKALRESSYVYTVTDRETGKKRLIQDSEVQQYLSVREQQKLLGKNWILKGLYGDYDLKKKFNKNTSPHLITVFERKQMSSRT